MAGVEDGIRENAPYMDKLAALTANTMSPFLISTQDSIRIDGDLHDVNLVDSQVYESAFYGDRNTEKFVSSAITYFVLESQNISRLRILLKQGNEIASMLYSYRSVSRAIPQVQPDDPRKAEHYKKQYEVLLPEVEKMKKFMEFRDFAISTVSDVLQTIVPAIKDKEVIHSTDFLLTFAEVLDMFIRMDALKNIKSSMNNDFSMYRRTVSNIQTLATNPEETVMQHKLYSFLANHDQYSAELKTALTNLPFSYDEIAIETLQTCADYLENTSGRPVFYEQKHSLLRVMAFCIYLLDGNTDDTDITKRKKLKLDRYIKLFKQTPIVTLFADLSLELSMLYKKGPHLRDVKWEETDESSKRAIANNYSLLNGMDAIRAEHTDLLAQIAKIQSNLKSSNHKRATANNMPHLTTDEEQVIANVLLQGVRLLAKASTKVHEQVAYKYNNPVAVNPAKGIPEDALPYELSVRYNYSDEEKKALIVYISILKSLSNSLLRLHSDFAPHIIKSIHIDIESFAHLPLTEAIQFSVKKKKTISGFLKYIRDIAGDGPFAEDEVKKSKSKTVAADVHMPGSGKQRLSPISPTQLHFVRKLIEFIFTDRAGKGVKGGLIQQADFSSTVKNDITVFLGKTWNYQILLDFEHSVSKLSDLSDLWYKEFYLELSKQVQFPIDCSLPYILMEYARSTNDATIQQYLIFPLELYNDAAKKALHELKCRYLYDEITAEVNLCFDLTIYAFSENMYKHYKRIASERIISPEFKPDDFGIPVRGLPVDIFNDLLAQRDCNILGRNVDFANVFSNMFQAHIMASLEAAFARLEAFEFSHIVEFDSLVEVSKETHRIVSALVPMPPFDDLYNQADETVSLVAANGRFLSYFLREVIFDVAPNFCYNNTTERFFRTPNTFVGEYTRPPCVKFFPKDLFGSRALHTAFTAQNSSLYRFIGTEHIEIALKYLRRRGIPIVLNEIIRKLNSILKDDLTPYIDVVSKGIPASLKLPLFEYGVEGTYDYFKIQLKPLIEYPDMTAKILQSFREIGNHILIVKCLEDTLNVRDVLFDIQNAGTVLPSTSGQSAAMDVTLATDAKLRDSAISTDPNQEWAVYFEDIIRRTKDVYSYSHATVLVAKLLLHIKQTLYSLGNEWQSTGALDNPRAFFRLWSVIQFIFCLPSIGEGLTVRELYGDSLSWGGCTLVHLFHQYHSFRAFDFNSHILTVQRADKKLGGLQFGYGQYGGQLQPGMSVASSSISSAQQQAQQGEKSHALQTAIVAAASNAAAALDMRNEVTQFMENAVFYSDLSEEVFATLEGLQSVATEDN